MRQQQQPSRGGIPSTPFLNIFDDRSERSYSRSINNSHNGSDSSSSIYNDTIRLDKISNNNTNCYAIPENHVIVPKQLLYGVMDDNHKNNEILNRMLPSKIIKDLSEGKLSLPENFDEVTILFSDIVGIYHHH